MFQESWLRGSELCATDPECGPESFIVRWTFRKALNHVVVSQSRGELIWTPPKNSIPYHGDPPAWYPSFEKTLNPKPCISLHAPIYAPKNPCNEYPEFWETPCHARPLNPSKVWIQFTAPLRFIRLHLVFIRWAPHPVVVV